MKKVELEITIPNAKIVPWIIVNGKNVKVKKVNSILYKTTFLINDESIEMMIFHGHELEGKYWYLFAILSYFISFLGIFNPPYSKNYLSSYVKLLFKIEDDEKIVLRYNNFKQSKKALEVICEADFEEIENEYYLNSSIKKRRIILLIGKLIVWILLSIFVGYFMTKFF